MESTRSCLLQELLSTNSYSSVTFDHESKERIEINRELIRKLVDEILTQPMLYLNQNNCDSSNNVGEDSITPYKYTMH